MKKYSLLLLVSTSFFFACNKTTNNVGSTPTPTPVVSKIAPDGFTYHTSKTVSISVSTLSNDNKPLSEVPINIYSINAGAVDQLLYKGFTDASGNFTTSINIPSTYDTLVIDPAYIGLVRLAKVLITGNTVNCTIGGTTGY